MSKRTYSSEDWITDFSKESGLNKNLTEQAWDSFVSLVLKKLKTDPEKMCYIPRFGTFMIAKHKGHPLNLNIANGEKEIADYETLKFKPSSSFKSEALNKDKA